MSRKTAAERRTDALAAARQLILDQGVEAASVRNVAAAAGMSAGSLRHIFPSHDDLFVALLEDAEAASRQRIMALVARYDADRRAGRPRGPRDLVVDMLLQVEPVDGPSRSDLLVQLAVLTAHPGNERLAAVRRRIGDALDELCGDAVRSLRSSGTDGPGGDGLSTLVDSAVELRLILDGAALRIIENPGYGEAEVRAVLVKTLDRLVPSRGQA